MAEAGSGPDRVRLVISLVIYCSLYYVSTILLVPPLNWLGGYLAGITVSHLAGAVLANLVVVRIYENQRFADIGLWWNRVSARNLALGLAGGAGSAALVLTLPLISGAATMQRGAEGGAEWASWITLSLLLLAGSAGEEILFRGYGFQALIRAAGPGPAVAVVGALFSVLHASNPNASGIGLANTTGFGLLFGFAFLRSRDLWLPVGLHFGWNITLPLFGANVSGFRMKAAGYEIAWKAGSLWSGGEYGPEASILTSLVLVALLLYLWKAPVQRQAGR